MWPLTLLLAATASSLVSSQLFTPKTGDELVASVAENCVDIQCVKEHVLGFLDNVLQIEGGSARSYKKDIDGTIFKRAAKILRTREIRYQLPETFFDGSEVIYNPRTGLDVTPKDNEARGLLKKKLLLTALLLLKLKLKALMPIFVAIIGIKALKALILSKLAILIVIGFVAYQLLTKAGMPMPMMMPPAEPPSTGYGAPGPAPSSPPPNSYEPGWEPSSQGGPYARVWNNVNEPQSLAYSAYYPGTTGISSTTSRP